MAQIVAAWCVLYVIYLGIGLIVMPTERHSTRALIGTMWAGWFVVLGFLQVWHIFRRVDALALVVLGVVALGGLALRRERLRRWWQALPRRRLFSGGVLFGLVLLALANLGLSGRYIYDVGLYYLPLVKWMETYPVVLGLSNIHYRFSANSPFFLYSALLNLKVGVLTAPTLVSGSVMALLCAYFIAPLTKVFGGLRLHKGERLLLLMLPAAFLLILGPYSDWLTSFTPDLAVFVLGLVVVYWAYHVLTDPTLDDLILVMLGCIIGTEIKVSFAVFALGVALVVMGRFAYRGELRQLPLGRLALGAALLIVPWFIYGFLVSGYVIAPMGFVRLPVWWSTPEPFYWQGNDAIRSWARQPNVRSDVVLSSWAWFSPWLEGLPALPAFAPLAMGGVLGAVNISKLRRGALTPQPAVLLLLAVVLVNLVFWFFSAPDPRFAGATLWLIPILLFLHAFQDDVQTVLFVLPFIVLMLSSWPSFVLPGEYQGLVPYPQPVIESQTVGGGTLYYAGEGHAQCWDAPLPCAIHFEVHLIFRDPNDLSKGFDLDFAYPGSRFP